ncbi:MAG: MFS transporter [Clostridia bacterium]|nr:MFS transporter [Clostridia bacterium]
MIKEKASRFKGQLMNNPSFTLKEQLGYASGIFGNCMAQDSVETFSDKFFRQFMGIEGKLMTWMSNILLLIGFAVPPVAGNILDTPVKLNKRTPTKTILMLMPIPFAITAMLLFVVPFSSSFKNFLWALLVKLVYNTVDAFYDLSLNTLSLRMTTNAKDRKNFYTVSTLSSALGSMLPGWIIPIFVGSAADANKQKWTYFFIALIFCILGIITMYAPYFTLEEKIRVAEKPKKSAINWDRETLSTMVNTRTFMIVQIANFFEQIRQLSYKLLPYIYDDVFDDYKMKAIIDAISGGLSYAGLAAVPVITNAVSARTVMCGGYAFTGIFYAIMSLFSIGFDVKKLRKRRYIIGIMIGIAGMPNNAISASKKVVVGDSTDYMEWYSQKNFGTPIRSEGLVSATQSVLGNLYNLIRTNIYNIVFDKLNYKPNTIDAITGKEIKAAQTPKTLKGIYLMFTLCGIIGNFLASASYLFDDYTGNKKKRILAELDQMRAIREEVTAKRLAEEQALETDAEAETATEIG